MPIVSSINSSKALFESIIWNTSTLDSNVKNANVHEDTSNDKNENLHTQNKPRPRTNIILKRQMTSIGRFALRSQTEENPSIISFFVALVHEEGKDINVDEFTEIWEKRVMDKYDRFRFQVSSEDDRYFEVNKKPTKKYFSTIQHPAKIDEEFQDRIRSMLLSPFDVRRGLWEAQLSSGDLGASGAISKDQFQGSVRTLSRETLVLFRVHHSLCDGVSLSVAIGDLADESKQLHDKLKQEITRRKMSTRYKQKSVVSAFLLCVQMVVWYLFSTLYAIVVQLWRMVSATNPFDEVMARSELPPGTRSIAWRNLDSLQEVKTVSKRVCASTTVNDLTVHLVTYAIRRQLDEHKKRFTKDQAIGKNLDPENVNIVIPVHLNGGMIETGESLGNKIGAFVATVPLPRKGGKSSCTEMKDLSQILRRGKSSPAPLISWLLAKCCSDYTPDWWTTFMIRKCNAKSVAVISNVKGWPFHVHWLGRKVGFLCAFLPLPPGIPIGVVVQSYDDNISFSVNADERAVPDANMFANWMVEEYERMKGIDACGNISQSQLHTSYKSD